MLLVKCHVVYRLTGVIIGVLMLCRSYTNDVKLRVALIIY